MTMSRSVVRNAPVRQDARRRPHRARVGHLEVAADADERRVEEDREREAEVAEERERE
jgi:hypothetical protein